MRLVISLFGLVLALGSAAVLRYLPTPQKTNIQAATGSRERQAAISLAQTALNRDPASPYRWADLAEAYFAAHDTAHARKCFTRALELGPHILPVWIRDANFHYELGEPQRALNATAHVLNAVPNYDDILFSYFDRLVPDPADVLSCIGSDKRASVSYLNHLMQGGNISAASIAWRNVIANHFADDQLAAHYTSFLLRNKHYDDAAKSWGQYVGERGGDYPETNLLFNGGFETNPSGAELDWRMQPFENVETLFDNTNPRHGRSSLHIIFHGNENVGYHNATQTVRVHAGTYRLLAWVRTESITTNEGLRFRVFDYENPSRFDIVTTPITATHNWTMIEQIASVSGDTNLVSIELCRLPSQKFDNKIAGTAWVDDVSFTLLNNAAVARRTGSPGV